MMFHISFMLYLALAVVTAGISDTTDEDTCSTCQSTTGDEVALLQLKLAAEHAHRVATDEDPSKNLEVIETKVEASDPWSDKIVAVGDASQSTDQVIPTLPVAAPSQPTVQAKASESANEGGRIGSEFDSVDNNKNQASQVMSATENKVSAVKSAAEVQQDPKKQQHPKGLNPGAHFGRLVHANLNPEESNSKVSIDRLQRAEEMADYIGVTCGMGAWWAGMFEHRLTTASIQMGLSPWGVRLAEWLGFLKPIVKFVKAVWKAMHGAFLGGMSAATQAASQASKKAPKLDKDKDSDKDDD